jgi:dTDP-4-dehydrorhamnose 3,5-epimerase
MEEWQRPPVNERATDLRLFQSNANDGEREMTTRFDMLPTPLDGLKAVRRKPVGDARGFLERMFCAQEFEQFLYGKSITQINRTLTKKCGTVRGMHFQYVPHTEMKFVTCLRGEVFDVAVDVRKNSPTFLRWHGEMLTQDNHMMLLIPEGFAHGFQTLSNDCEMLYFHTAVYCAESEGALHAQDPRLAIKWPLAISEQSDRDTAHPFLTLDFQGVAP